MKRTLNVLLGIAAVVAVLAFLVGCSNPTDSGSSMALPPEPSYELIAGRVSADVFVDLPAGYPDRFPFPIRYELRLAQVVDSKWEVHRDFGFHSDTAVHLYLTGYDPERVHRYQLRSCWDIRGLAVTPSGWCSDWTHTRYIEPVSE